MEELKCLRRYKGGQSSLINRELRKNNPTSEIIRIESQINCALNQLKKVPNYTLFRVEQSIYSFDKIKSWFTNRISQNINFPAFTSCSLEKKWMKDREFVFEIKTTQTTNAHSLSELFPNNPESEVLFKSKTNFKILSVNELTRTITLSETKEPYDIVIYENEYFFTEPLSHLNKIQSLSDLDEI